MGHFVVIHEVKDLAFRQRIIEALGEDISFSPSYQGDEGTEAAHAVNGGNTPAKNREHIQGPFTEKELLERNSAQAVLPWNPTSKLDDWYN